MQEIRTTADGKLKLIVAGRSDLGCVRQNNEDSYGFFDNGSPERGWLLVVADGMGGAAGGEVASRVAVETLSERYFGAAGAARDALLESIESANLAILAEAEREPKLAGMGTTCTVSVITGQSLTVGHVGDSRAYLLRAGALEQLTHDHSLAAELERREGRSDLANTPGRNVLTRCLGVAPDVKIDMVEDVELEMDNALVMCSDGLSNMVTADEIRDVVDTLLPEKACERLVNLARQRGGPDNITVQVARFEPS